MKTVKIPLILAIQIEEMANDHLRTLPFNDQKECLQKRLTEFSERIKLVELQEKFNEDL